MTAITSYLVDARMMELRDSGLRAGRASLNGLLAEAVQVLLGGLTPTSRSGDDLSPNLREDLGLR